jgi:4-hydroxybutyrate CoA-transferase
MDWKEEYKSKIISAEDAAGLVKSNDYVVMGSLEPLALGLALAVRKEELSNVRVYVIAPAYDLLWYEEGWEDSFPIIVQVPTDICKEMNERRGLDISIEFLPLGIPPQPTHDPMTDYIYMIAVSPPDDRGFCSFGASLWDKKARIKNARMTIAEINPNFIRTYGDNFIHVSDIDYFVEEHVSRGITAGTGGMGSMGGKKIKESEPYLKTIAGLVSTLIPDGSTLQIGLGRTTEQLVRLGMLDDKHDLGFHSEVTVPGIIPLVRKGVINGECKTLDKGKCVATGVGGGTLEEMKWVSDNPLFYVAEINYVGDVRVLAAQDNFVAINNVLAADLTGQLTAESLGTKVISTAGGQCAFVCGAWMSKDGRSISVLPSTAQTANGLTSRIMPTLPQGTAVTVPRTLVDCVITEYGIAQLKGKTLKQRVRELISIAHPDFRAELKKQAEKLYL